MLIRLAAIVILAIFSIRAYAQSLEIDFDGDGEPDYVACQFVGKVGVDGSGRLYCWYISTSLGNVNELQLPYLEDLTNVSFNNNQLNISASSNRCDFSVHFAWHSNTGFVHTEAVKLECWR
ncbi:MAG TPA: hypothetical protein DHW71_05010 [Gammaproteobacteria bacterium]|uniref:hypothetical protein n=1 Tax=Alteromonas australica TaxID=589873 RepID=UPI000EC25F47|nr:hypothetical protein [Alteromonas australica]HCK92323.1 hypothetical protein [Gammaproteobacteria bacterium]|tara:strand:+ start:5436 stop:5798 length:363 start_codon:yes stop_codon:yes gene_type:complete